MARQQPTLEELLIASGLLKAAQVDDLVRRAAQQKKSLEQVIQEEKLVYPEPLAQLKAKALGLPYVDLNTIEVDLRAAQGISDKAAHTYQFVVFGQKKDTLQVAMAAPDAYQAKEAVRFIATQRGLKAEIYYASPDAIAKTQRQYNAGDVGQVLKDFGQELKQAGNVPKESNKLHDALAQAPVTKVVAVIIRHAIDGLASDIHIEPSLKQIRVRYRIAGELHTTLLLPAEIQPSLASRIKILANLQVARSGIPQEGRFTLTIEQQAYSIRVSVMPTIAGERITLHLADATHPPPSFRELGMSEQQQALLTEHLKSSDGLIVVAGPGKTGKSTTLFAALWEINSPDTSLATLEDQVEFEIPGISQTQIRRSQGLTYAAALASLMRQDIDVIMISELPNGKAAELAAHAAMNGRLILSTVPAPDAVQAIIHLISLGLSPYLLSASLRVLVGQRLVPKLCQACREAVPIPRDLRPDIQAELKQIPKAYLRSLKLPAKHSFFSSRGCPDCHEEKTQGQIALFEVVPAFQELRAGIASGADAETLEKLIRRKGYLSLRQDGVIKALQGKVRYSDVARATS